MYNSKGQGQGQSRPLSEDSSSETGRDSLPSSDHLRQSEEQSHLSKAPVALIADDDEFFRMALKVILIEKLGFHEVIETYSLDEAVERLADRGDISLALFDLSMPGMKSAASLRAVRECFCNIKIVVISGSNRRSDILLALSSGVHGYVPKSLGASVICEALKLVTGGSIYVPSSVAEIGPKEEDAPRCCTPPQNAADNLTPRQRDVLKLLVQGQSNKEIARSLNLGEGTVKVHMSALLRSLGAASRSAAAALGAKILT